MAGKGYGFHRDVANNEIDILANGVIVFSSSATAVTLPAAVTSGLTVTAGGVNVTAGGVTVTAGGLRFGTGTQVLGVGVPGSDVDIASGVLTVTRVYSVVAAESGTTDQVDSIVLSGQTAGDILILESNSTDTITYDDATIELGGTARACAPGGKMFLVYNGSNWSEISFVATADNA